MHERTDRISELAARARDGDEQARRQLRQSLVPALERIAKAALRPGVAATVLSAQLRAAARRLGGNADSDHQALAESLGRLIVTRIHPGVTEVASPTLLTA